MGGRATPPEAHVVPAGLEPARRMLRESGDVGAHGGFEAVAGAAVDPHGDVEFALASEQVVGGVVRRAVEGDTGGGDRPPTAGPAVPVT